MLIINKILTKKNDEGLDSIKGRDLQIYTSQ